MYHNAERSVRYSRIAITYLLVLFMKELINLLAVVT